MAFRGGKSKIGASVGIGILAVCFIIQKGNIFEITQEIDKNGYEEESV